MEDGDLPGFIGALVGAGIVIGVVVAMGVIILAFMFAGNA
jgi:hypothetical protein